MSYDAEAAKVGRIPFVFVELYLTSCSRVYGSGLCTAAVGVTGDQKCFNTYASCQDKQNFSETLKTYRLCQNTSAIPVGFTGIPLIKADGISYASQEITPGKGLGVRGSVRIRLQDAPWPDTEIDPYWQERDYDTTEQGTFLGKFLARNPYHSGRLMRVYEGFLTPAFSLSNFRGQAFIIDQIEGILKNDEGEIIGKDLLALADDKKALYPPPSRGVLAAAIAAGDTVFTVEPAGVGSEYPAAGKVCVGGEEMEYTRAGDAFTVTRAAGNTEAVDHDAGDTVQWVAVFDREEIQDVLYTLLTVGAGIDSSFIDLAAWTAERDAYMAGVWSADIVEPTGVNALISELTEQAAFRLWWDGYEQEIRFKAIKPMPDDLPVFTDAGELQAVDVKLDGKQRVSTVLVYFAQKTPVANLDDRSNYLLRVGTPDAEAIGWREYGSNQIRKIYSRWFRKTSMARVNALSDAILKTYRDPPRIMSMKMDARHGLKVGDQFIAMTRRIQDMTGAPAPTPFEVLYAQPEKSGTLISYRAQSVSSAIPPSNTRGLEISEPLTLDLNLYEAYQEEYGPADEGIVVIITILPGVLVSSSSTATPAIQPGDWPEGVTVRLVNQGIVAGRGGDGGHGQGYSVTPEDVAGKDGGIAIDASGYPMEVDNSEGFIAGGAGGGGGGDLDAYLIGGSLHIVTGGGGGGGWPLGTGGAAGTWSSGTYVYPGSAGSAPASNGLTGGEGRGGFGGNGNTVLLSSGIVLSSGPGGDAGCRIIGTNYDGADGGEGSGYTTGSAPGPAGVQGPCIVGNANITWLSTGERRGAIS